jgi:serine/threonine-protein kinase
MTKQTSRAHCGKCGASYPAGGFAVCPYDRSPLVVGPDPLIGCVLAARYRVDRLVGEGAAGRVYEASHATLRRRYAVKVPANTMAADEKARLRFLHEAEAASRLDHPNVAAVIDVGETDGGLPYMVMELASGDTLSRVIAVREQIPVLEALDIARQIALGLDHAHQSGLVHRDLKPGNIMVDRRDCRPRILDFGLALVPDLGEAARLTTRGIVVGTPQYMSPEQARGRAIDHRTDIFALGLILYEMIAGCMPFDGDALDVVTRNVSEPLPRFKDRVPGLLVDEEVETLIDELTAKKPEHRPRDAAEVARMLAALAEQLDDRSRMRPRNKRTIARWGTLTPRLPG